VIALIVVLLGIPVLLSGCSTAPEAFAPPPQRPFFARGPEPARMVAMADGDADLLIVRDISGELEADTWRWTGKRPTVRVWATSNQNLTFGMDFAIAGSTIAHTGPVTVSFFVNDHLLGQERYDKPGRYRVVKPVPAAWIDPERPATVAAEIDKTYTPSKDKGPLGFILVSLGLEKAEPGRAGIETEGNAAR
jgi:hypothetical protein